MVVDAYIKQNHCISEQFEIAYSDGSQLRGRDPDIHLGSQEIANISFRYLMIHFRI